MQYSIYVLMEKVNEVMPLRYEPANFINCFIEGGYPINLSFLNEPIYTLFRSAMLFSTTASNISSFELK